MGDIVKFNPPVRGDLVFECGCGSRFFRLQIDGTVICWQCDQRKNDIGCFEKNPIPRDL